MEIRAYEQKTYDHLGVIREDLDRICNMAILGTDTFKWIFLVRQEEIAGPTPFFRLESSSGVFWEFGQDSACDRIPGLANQFFQVVTKVRNIADTRLVVFGSVVSEWMSKAQCFAGVVEKPPTAGTSFTRSF